MGVKEIKETMIEEQRREVLQKLKENFPEIYQGIMKNIKEDAIIKAKLQDDNIALYNYALKWYQKQYKLNLKQYFF